MAVLCGCKLNHLCYADDLCLISLSSSGMSKLLHICELYGKTHGLTYNSSKSMCMSFFPKCVKIEKPPLLLNGSVIPYVDQCKYLGTLIHINSPDSDLKRQMKKNVL